MQDYYVTSVLLFVPNLSKYCIFYNIILHIICNIYKYNNNPFENIKKIYLIVNLRSPTFHILNVIKLVCDDDILIQKYVTKGM